MLGKIVWFSISRPWQVLFLTLVVSLAGLWSFQRLPIDAVPDVTDVQVQINASAPGYSPLEVEQRITYPVETALAGIPGLSHTRSLSSYGISQVTAVFREGTDLYFARSRISERLEQVSNDLPNGIAAEMGPIATGLGEILMYSLDADAGAIEDDGTPIDLADLREIQEWVVRRQLVQVEGITEINSIGGFEKEYHVLPDPQRMLQSGITFDELIAALRSNNASRGAGFVESNGQQLLIRVTGQLQAVEDIAKVQVGVRDGRSVRVGDLAEVAIGHASRMGAAILEGREVVLGTAIMLQGENSRTVARRVTAKLVEINRTLPEGVHAEVLYDRTTLVNRTIGTVQENLLMGALLVIVVLLVMLGNIKAALITACIIPLTMLCILTGMVQAGISANLMSLGALDFGLIVDGAVIIVENTMRRLSSAKGADEGERLTLIHASACEVMRPALFGIGIITLVYIPVFTLTGVEGRMFYPMAATVVMGLVIAMLLALSFVPAAIALFLRHTTEARETRVTHAIENLYRPLLNQALKFSWALLLTVAATTLAAGWLALSLGREFIPELDEGDIAIEASGIPGTGLEQTIKLQKAVEHVIGTFPQVDRVFAKLGTAEIATDPVPPSSADTFVMLRPREEWPDTSLAKETLVEQIEAAVLELPGSNYEFSQPIQLRFNELLTGIRAELGIKVMGEDLDTLQQLGEQILEVIEGIEGVSDERLERLSGLPMLTVTPRLEGLSQYGVDISTLQDLVSTAMDGTNGGLIYQGDRRFPIVVRLPESLREDFKRLESLPVPLPQDAGIEAAYVPLGEIADVQLLEAPNQIRRENGQRHVVVTANVRGRDLGSFVEEAQRRIADEVAIPSGYFVDYGGTFEQLQSAGRRLAIVVPVTLLLIFALLLFAFSSLRDALIIFSGIPLALSGGVLALWIRGMPLSVTAGIGFIALSGIAVLNGLVMLSFIKTRWKEVGTLLTSIVEGSLTRLRPVLMTALVASLGFVPMALNTGVGAEVQRPLATVVIGGIVSSTMLTLFVLPALYWLAHRGRRTCPQ